MCMLVHIEASQIRNNVTSEFFLFTFIEKYQENTTLSSTNTWL
jgi:hypothetical protein